MKIIYYKPVKVIINALRLVKVIVNIVVWYYGLFNLIVIDKTCYLSLSSDYCFATSLLSNKTFLLFFIYK